MREAIAMADKPGLFARARAATQLLLKGQVDRTLWFGPLEPFPAMAPPSVAGRRFDYPQAFNLTTQPRGIDGRGEARIPFWQLRALADNYDVLRLVIETRKDQLKSLEWTIQPRDAERRRKGDPRTAAATEFFNRPDGDHDWDQWLGALIEDMFVIDAATVFVRRSRGGAIAGFDVVDGSTIKPVIDDHGRVPAPPLPAYQQILHGLPAVDYAALPPLADGATAFSSDQILYLPRNWRSAWVYGLGPVEQIVMTVNIALRRQLHTLMYYTEGTVPDALCSVPDGWTIDQIAEFQAYFDSLLTDNLAQRRKLRFVPPGISKGFVQTKEAALKDDTDEWLARIVSFAFSISPQWAVKQMNRASAEQANEAALEEGLAPSKLWIKKLVDRCLATQDQGDLEFAWSQSDEMDAESQNTILTAQLAKGAITLDEFREEMGREPYPNGAGATPLIFTATGAVTLESVLAPPPPPAPPADAPAGSSTDGPGARSGENGAAGRPAGGEGEIERSPEHLNGSEAMAKSYPAASPLRPAARLAQSSLERVWSRLLQAEGTRIAAAVRDGRTLAKADLPEDEEIFLDPDAWDAAEQDSRAILAALATDSAGAALLELGLTAAGITSLANPAAVAWAKEHAATLVSQVSDATRNRLRDLVAQSEAEGWPVATLADAIAADGFFAPARAARIALNETREADNHGALAGMRAASQDGVSTEKSWQPRGDNVCPECQANEGDGWIASGDAFNSGDDTAPGHPGCECDVEFRLASDETALAKYSDDQPRDADGRWSAGGGGDEREGMRAALAEHGFKRTRVERGKGTEFYQHPASGRSVAVHPPVESRRAGQASLRALPAAWAESVRVPGGAVTHSGNTAASLREHLGHGS